MSYQVLARKWRPKTFEQLVGQKQTAKALMNALDSQRLHHAYLFTGTRGVGKTTIARILSKSLNCETGVTSNPCGNCSSCIEIDQGNFVDLMEIDAASKTKVEDTRELLDNVQYRPTRGRYKVYLIDEVHMLSGHSFNALLKTLEEPPPHVIFLLATTDPQKLPVTVLSRCLQFNLRRMEEAQIIEHLSMILKAESISYEDAALKPIAKGADGSMRDALSLLDQAIAYSGETVALDQVLEMLGSIDQSYCFKILEAVRNSDASGLMSTIQEMSQYSPNYMEIMADWLTLLHSIAVVQATGSVDDESILALSQQIAPADLQLFYQLSLQAKKDLPYAPHPRQGFEMALLRVIAFRPLKKMPVTQQKSSQNSASKQVLDDTQKKKIADSAPPSTTNNGALISTGDSANLECRATEESKQVALNDSVKEPSSNEEKRVATVNGKKPIEPTIHETESDTSNLLNIKKISTIDKIETIELENVKEANWHQVVGQIKAGGNGLQILLKSIGRYEGKTLEISHLKSVSHFLTEKLLVSLKLSLREHFRTTELTITFVEKEELNKTPKERQNENYQKALDSSYRDLKEDVCVKTLSDGIGLTVDKSSIQFDNKDSIIALV